MEYFEISIKTTHEFSEIVASTLIEFGCEGVAIYDSQDLIELENSFKSWDYIEDGLKKYDPLVLVCGCFVDLGKRAEIIDALELELDRIKAITPFDCGSLELTSRIGEDTDWLTSFKKHFQPIETDGLVVVTPFNKIEHKKPCIIIEPSMAFGTGSHETTRMCLELMQEIDIEGRRILDLGCGSGILGLSSLILGARQALLLDYDENAIKCTRENATLNHLENFEVKQNDLLVGIDFKADLILANLTASLLSRAVQDIYRLAIDAGYVIVSGIIEGKESEVEQMFLQQGFKKITQKNMNDWYAFVFQK